MTAKRMYFVLLGLILLLLVSLLGGVYGFKSLLKGQSVQLANAKLEYQILSDQEKGLKKDKQDIITYGGLSNLTKQIVPQDKNQAEAIREILTIAAASTVTRFDRGVKITNISFPQSTLGTTGVAANHGVSTTTTPAAAADTKSALSQLTAVPNIPGVYKLSINLANDPNTAITYPMFYKFLAGLESNRRTAQVTSISLQPVSNNTLYLTFSLTVDTYIKP